MFSYAQNFEDVILARLFDGKTNGFYVDIGASHPEFLSVTKYFYDLGWTGVNIEPIKSQWELFVSERPRDININAAIGRGAEKIMLTRMLGNSALSTTNITRSIELCGSQDDYELTEVDLLTADSIFEKYDLKEVDFLKIDVEGSEADVLFSLNLVKYRPKILIIEAVKPLESAFIWEKFDINKNANWHTWSSYVLDNDYLEAYFDGLNKFYVKKECSNLLPRFSMPPGVFDNIIPDIVSKGFVLAEEKEGVIQEQKAVIQEQQAVIREKEVFIHEIAKDLRVYRVAYGCISPLRTIARMIRRGFEIIRPRLGNLNQYAPRQPNINAVSTKKSLGYYPAISIVTPSFAQGEYIERTLLSVINQRYPNLEFFVEDGASKDNTTEVLEKYQEALSGWISEEDAGQSQAINRGFAKTCGEIMGWLNSDDLLLPGALHSVADYFNRHPDVDVVYGNRLLIDENDMEIGRWILPGHDSDILSWVDYVPQETMFWRRGIWEKVGGGIDESFRFAMDWDLLVRFRDAGAKFGHIPQFLGAFRIHERQKTSAAINEIGHQEMDRIREHVLGRVPEIKEIRRAVLPYLVKHIAVDMAYRVKKRFGLIA